MERPLERRASARTAVLWDSVSGWLSEHLAGTTGTVVDIGGGTGGFAVRVAELGHLVTVIDPSPDALAALGRRAQDHGVADRVSAQQGDLAGLSELVEAASADLVLCHEVLGIVEDASAALASIGEVLRPGGALSLVVSQRHAAVLARAMVGQFKAALSILDGSETAGAERRFTHEEMTDLLVEAGFEQVRTHAVRVFGDLVPSALLDHEPGAVDELLELERAVANRPEYFTLAAQLHTIAVR